MKKQKQIENALLKRALGYDAEETVEEYAGDDGETRLLKRKVTRKNVPPDISAIKLLLEGCKEKHVCELSDEELEAEKQRLLKLLAQERKEEDNENKNQ